MDHDLTTAQLTPSEAMEQKLHLQKQAAIAVIEADNDARLRRALLRQHQGPSSFTTPLANASTTGETPLVEQDLNFDGKALQLW